MARTKKITVDQRDGYHVVTIKTHDPDGIVLNIEMRYGDGIYVEPMPKEKIKNKPGLRKLRRLEQDDRCIYCGEEFTGERPATVEHLTPLTRNGDNGWSNLALSCLPCNNEKSGCTDAEYRAYLARKDSHT